MQAQLLSHSRLMRESTERVQRALRGGNADEQLLAESILRHPDAWSQWASSHSDLMHELADCELPGEQTVALKQVTFRLLHGKALFQYLRQGEVRGAGRARVLAHFRPGSSYAHAVITEHHAYLRRACSFLCTRHVGSDVIEDPTFLDPLHRYEELYAEYFAAYCASLVESPASADNSQGALLPLLKHQLDECRWAILNPDRTRSWLGREIQLRTPTGDTQRLRTLGRHPRPRSRDR
jgi:hypothetical protein